MTEDSLPPRPIDYYFFDLPIVQQLAQKYLSKFPWLNVHTFHQNVDVDNIAATFDLCISNYAFSEFSIELQELYLDLVLKKCKRGYMIYNTLGEDSLGSYSAHDFIEKLRVRSIFAPIDQIYTEKEFPDDVLNITVIYWIGNNI
jgi:hypothetical protein